jgi:hypothetical protein
MDFDQDDITNIQAAIKEGGKIWENPLLENFKTKLKNYYRGLKNECCYCKRVFVGEFSYSIDIEHILPKSKFQNLMFATYNLNISCKRCNMKIKKSRTDFLLDIEQVKATPKDITLYKIIHPNFENYETHIEYFVNIDNQKKIIKYYILSNSEKGKYTFEYFKLRELEIDTVSQAQGVKEKGELSTEIAPNIIEQLEKAFKDL